MVLLAIALPIPVLLATVQGLNALDVGVELGRPLARIPLVTLKLAIGFVIFSWQQRPAELHELNSAATPLRSGLYVLIGAAVLRPKVLSALPYWFAVVLQ